MIKFILSPGQIVDSELSLVGGKVMSLAKMSLADFRVPLSIIITTWGYSQFLDQTGLRQRIILELERKPFEEMRWEELWDSSLRLRNLFAITHMPGQLEHGIANAIDLTFGDRIVVVRSSSPSEDSSLQA